MQLLLEFDLQKQTKHLSVEVDILFKQLICRDARSVCNIAKHIQRALHQFSKTDKHRYNIYYGHKFCEGRNVRNARHFGYSIKPDG